MSQKTDTSSFPISLSSQSNSPTPWALRIDGNIAHILDANGCEVTAILLLDEQDAANARLIAAVPALLQACQDALAFMEPDIQTLIDEGRRNAALNVKQRCEQLRAAIALTTIQ